MLEAPAPVQQRPVRNPEDMPALRPVTVALALLATLFAAAPAAAYIGPGAGFALMSSFLVLLGTVALAFVSLLAWPVRTLWRVIRRKKPPKAHVKRLVFVGLDGQDPRLTERMMKEGHLPNFKRLSKRGSYRRIASTYPALSPVAWSTFATGANPGKHNIFDFLDRDLRSYLPKLSSAHIGRVERFLKLGKWKIPLQKPEIRLLRRSKPFWTVLGERNVWSTVLRVPITFPPDRFYGAQLAAMCVPDLVGSQGTFLYYTTRPAVETIREGGVRVPLASNGAGPDHFDCVVEGAREQLPRGRPAAAAARADDGAGRPRGGVRHGDGGGRYGRAQAWRTLRLGADSVPGRARSQGPRPDPDDADRGRQAHLPVPDRDPHRPREAGDADLASLLLRALPRQAARRLRHSRSRGGHHRAQRGRDRRRDLPPAVVRHRPRARADVLCRAGAPAAGESDLRVRRHRPHSAHVLALHGERPSGGRGQEARQAPPRDRGPLPPQRRPGRPGDGEAGRRRSPDRAVGPRLRLLPARREPEPLAARPRLPGAPGGRRRQRAVAGGRGLVAHAGLRARSRRRVPEPQGPRGLRHRGTGRRGAGAQAGTHLGLERSARRGARRGRHQCRLRRRGPVHRSLQGQCPRPHHRLQRRLPRVLGLRRRRGRASGVRRQHEGLERRPLRRSAAGAGRVLQQPAG